MTSRDYARNDYEACLEVFDTNVPRFFRPEERVEYAAFLKALPGPYVVLLDGSASSHVVDMPFVRRTHRLTCVGAWCGRSYMDADSAKPWRG